jgi:hypothetical protein
MLRNPGKPASYKVSSTVNATTGDDNETIEVEADDSDDTFEADADEGDTIKVDANDSETIVPM